MVNRFHGTVAAADAVSLLKFLVSVVVGGGGFFRERKSYALPLPLVLYIT